MSIDQLNEEFSLEVDNNKLHFSMGAGDIPVVEIQNRHARAVISLQGAQVLSWIPAGEDEVIWVSEDATFAVGKSVRGGIPVCWPWFGAHDSNAAYPAHGFARTVMWQVIVTEALQDGSTRISLTMRPQEDNRSMWPTDTTVQLKLTIGRKLELELITHNNSATSISISQAFHSYFRVGDISKVFVHGLDDTDYLDKPDGFKRKHQSGPVSVEQEVDRIYLDTSNDCVIEDRALQRNIIVIKCGSHSTVLWNPGPVVAEKMGDLGEQGYRQMLCVESSNAADDVVTIEAGKAHQLWVQYEVKKL